MNLRSSNFLQPTLALWPVRRFREMSPAARAIWIVSCIVPALVFVALAIRQHLFVDQFAVNMMYWDQWDFYIPIFEKKGLWSMFTRQHGPPRLGVGLLITNLLAQTSHWNSRWDAFGVSYTIICSSITSLFLASECGLKIRLALIPIALIFFNLRQFESFEGAAILSHGAVPVCLLLLCSLCWFIRNDGIRLTLIGALTFLMTFTGFGIFAGLVIPLVLLIELGHAIHRREKIHAAFCGWALLIVATGWVLFSKGYVFSPAVDNFHFPHERPWEYLYFSGLMFGNFYGLPGVTWWSIAGGMSIVAATTAICLWHGWKILRSGLEPIRVVIFSLTLFVLIFCLNTAVGRISVGLDGALAPRYLTLLTPAALAIILHLQWVGSALEWRDGRKIAFLAALVYTGLLALGTLQLRDVEWNNIRSIRNGRMRWKRAYLRSKDELKANEQSKFKVYPNSGVITDRLNYLRKHKLNLFDPATRQE